MTEQGLKLEKIMTNQVVHMLGHAQWPSIISTPELGFRTSLAPTSPLPNHLIFEFNA